MKSTSDTRRSIIVCAAVAIWSTACDGDPAGQGGAGGGSSSQVTTTGSTGAGTGSGSTGAGTASSSGPTTTGGTGGMSAGGGGEGGGPAPAPFCLDGWCWSSPLPQGNDVYAIWGESPSDVWVGADHGAVLHWDGTSWSGVPFPQPYRITALWGAGPNDVWAATGAPTDSFVHWDGTSWTAFPSPPGLGVWHSLGGTSTSDVWASGALGNAHWDGSSWTAAPETTPLHKPFWGLHGATPDDYLAFTQNGGQMYHWDGSAWTLLDASPPAWPGTWTGPDQFVGVGADGAIWEWDSGLWSELHAGNQSGFGPVVSSWGTGPDDLYANPLNTYELQRWDGNGWAGTGLKLGEGLSFGSDDTWAIGGRGSIGHYDGASWQLLDPDVTAGARAIGGSSNNDIWVAGIGGMAARFDGTEWLEAPILSAPTSTDSFYALWGLSTGETYALGALQHDGLYWDPYLYEWDGTAWSPIPSFPSTTLYDVPCCLWGSSPTDLWAGSAQFLYHFDGNGWTDALPGDTLGVRAIWGSSAGDVWVSPTDSSGIYHWDGLTWTQHDAPAGIKDLWGSGPNDVWAISGGDIFHWDGTSWSNLSNPLGVGTLSVVGGAGTGDVFILSSYGDVLELSGSFVPSALPRRFAGPLDAWTSPDGRLWVLSDNGVVYHD